MRAFGLLILAAACQPVAPSRPVSHSGKADDVNQEADFRASLPTRDDGSVDLGFAVALPATRTHYRLDEWDAAGPYQIDRATVSLTFSCRLQGPSVDDLRVACIKGSTWGATWADGSFITYAIAAEEWDAANGYLRGRVIADTTVEPTIEIDSYDYTLPHHSGDYQAGPDHSYQEWYVDAFADTVTAPLQ